MRLGIGSYTYGWEVAQGHVSAPDLIDRARAMGVRVLQIADNMPPQTYDPESVEAIAVMAGEAGVQVELGARGCRPDHVRRFIRIAHRLAPPRCSTGPGQVLRLVLDSPDDHPSADEVVDRLADCLPDCAAAGVTIAIETHDRLRAAALADIILRLDSPHVGICLDVANSLGALEGPEVVVNALGPHVVNLHLKDFTVRRLPHLQGFIVEGSPAGQGMLDIPWLLSKLREAGRDACSAIAELWVPPEQEMDLTLARERQWAVQSVQALRRWIRE